MENQRTKLPLQELSTLLMTAIEATHLACQGDAAAGYEALLAGLHRARELAAHGVEWAAELVTRYEDAVARFTEEWPVGRA